MPLAYWGGDWAREWPGTIPTFTSCQRRRRSVRLDRQACGARVPAGTYSRCLAALGAHSYLVFHGGTALRLLCQTPRFSENLDFAYEPADGAFDFSALGASIAHHLRQEAYDVEVAVKTATVVAKGFVRFRGILYEMGVSPLPDETLLIKLEVDTNPPAGAILATSRVPRDYGPPVRVLHHDRAAGPGRL